MKERVLFLVGSARQPKSTSESLGDYLVNKLNEGGFDTEKLLIHKTINSEKSREKLLNSVENSTLLIMAFPLYVDSLPYLVIKTMELIKERRNRGSVTKKQKLLCIMNSGFSEAHHNDIALSICKKFAEETGFVWAGGFAMGGGGVISGKPLLKIKRTIRNVIKAFDISAEALLSNRDIPKEAFSLIRKPVIPRWLYNLIADLGWKKTAKKFGTQKMLYNRPYEEKDNEFI